MKVLFVCYRHQKQHFFSWHADFLIKSYKYDVSFLFFVYPSGDQKGITRASFFDLPSAILRVHGQIKSLSPDLIISITPKAGIIVSIGKILFWSKQKNIHWFTGQVWANDRGVKRYIKKLPDRITCLVASDVLCDSKPQRDYLVSQGFPGVKITVPSFGSICGVGDEILDHHFLRGQIQGRLRIGVVGRVCKDKGIDTLLEVFGDAALMALVDVELHFFGEIESLGEYTERFLNLIDSDDRWIYHGNVTDKISIYDRFDVLLMASHREGFSNVVLEAQAACLPVVCRSIYALQSTYESGNTGFGFSNNSELLSAIKKLSDSEIRVSMGNDAREFVRKRFKRKSVLNRVKEIYLATAQK